MVRREKKNKESVASWFTRSCLHDTEFLSLFLWCMLIQYTVLRYFGRMKLSPSRGKFRLSPRRTANVSVVMMPSSERYRLLPMRRLDTAEALATTACVLLASQVAIGFFRTAAISAVDEKVGRFACSPGSDKLHRFVTYLICTGCFCFSQITCSGISIICGHYFSGRCVYGAGHDKIRLFVCFSSSRA